MMIFSTGIIIFNELISGYFGIFCFGYFCQITAIHRELGFAVGHGDEGDLGEHAKNTHGFY
jgi:hypothetical protein